MLVRRIALVSLGAIVALTLSASPAFAQRFGPKPMTEETLTAEAKSAPTDVHCQPINGHMGELGAIFPCEFQGWDYPVCQDVPIWGTLNGTWRAQTDWGTWEDLEAPADLLGHSFPFATMSSVTVIKTNRGDVFGYEADIWIEYPYWSGLLMWEVEIIGGNGAYEDATGRFGVVYDVRHPRGNKTVQTGVVFGVLCTPIEE